MKFVFDMIESNSYLLELSVAILIVMINLNKEKAWVLKYGLVVLSTAAVRQWMGWYGQYSFLLVVLEYMIIIVVCCFAAKISFSVSLLDAVYGTLCGYALQHFASSFYILIRTVLGIAVHKDGWITYSTLGLYLVSYAGVYIIFYHCILKKLPRNGKFSVKFSQFAEISLIVVAVALILSLFEKLYGGGGIDFIICQIYAMVCSLFVLWAQYWQRKSVYLQAEVEVQKQLMESRKRQYEESLTNIDLINQKCHDLKYQIEILKQIDGKKVLDESVDELKQAIQFYDTSLQTDNEVLNTVLMEKSLLCNKCGIQMTCLADVKQIEFMNPIDLYSVFGNAIDNAIEAVRGIANQEKRIIAVSIFAKEQLTILQIENYYEGEISFRDKLPVTNKDDKNYHGFGLKSIQKTIEKYNGSMSIQTEDHIFILSILFPRNKE